MAFKVAHHRRYPQLHDRFARSDALLIGPGGEIVAAYGSGNRIPAIPEVVTGRLEQYTPASDTLGSTLSIAAVQVTASIPSATLAPTTAAMDSTSVLNTASLISTTSSASSTPTVSSVSLASTSSSSPSSSSTATSSAASGTIFPSSSSTSSTPTSSSNVGNTPGFAHNRKDLYIGIIFAAIAIIALFIALITWRYRTRSRTRRHERRNGTFWPWDRTNGDMEDGLDAGKTYDYGRFGTWGSRQKERVDGELPYPQFPARILGADEMLRVSQHFPVHASPFRPVIPHLQSVPDLTPNLGLLQVANYAPGDASSDEGSRVNSRQGTAAPLKSAHSSAGEWSTYGPEDEFQNPWPPLRPRPRHGLGISDVSDSCSLSEASESSRSGARSAASLQEGWASSLRSNIVNALHAVVGGQNASIEDSLPSKERVSRTASPEGPQEDTQSCNTSILLNPHGSTLDETCSASSGDDPVLEPQHDLDCLCEWLNGKPKTTENLDVFRDPSPDLGCSEKDALASTVNLAPIPPLRTGSISSLQRKQLRRGRSKMFPPRHTVLDRMYSASNSSVGSDMSRSMSKASTTSGPLSDQEQYAVTMLRERRKRVMNAQRLAARQSVRRPTVRLGSRRQAKGTNPLAAVGSASSTEQSVC